MCAFILTKQKYKVYVSLLSGSVILHHEHELSLDPLHPVEVLVAGLPTVQYSTVQYSTIQYSLMQIRISLTDQQYSTVQYSTVHFSCFSPVSELALPDEGFNLGYPLGLAEVSVECRSKCESCSEDN